MLQPHAHDPRSMRLTDAAAERIHEIMAQADKPVAGVRVGVKNGGCAGMEYTMEYADGQQPLDEVVEDKGVKILIDPKAVLFLLGTEMDYKTDEAEVGLRVQQSEPDLRLRLRRERPVETGRGRRLSVSASASFREFLIEHMAGFGPVTIRAMFGGAGVYREGLMFALIDDEVLYLKADDSTKQSFLAENLPPFIYAAKGGRKMEMSYYRIPERCLDDADEMATWCRAAYTAALKAAAKKKPRK